MYLSVWTPDVLITLHCPCSLMMGRHMHK